MRVRGKAGSARPVGVLLAGVLLAGVSLGAGGSGRTPADPARVASPVDEAAGTDPARPELVAEPADQDAAPADQEPAAERPGSQDPPAGEPPAPPARAGDQDGPAAPGPSRYPDVAVRYRVEVRTPDASVAGFPAAVHDVLTDPRGWARAGFRFVRDPEAIYTVVLAEGDEVDRLCHPYDTAGAYSCQNGPLVVVNADRWRGATPAWPGSLAGYRTMLVNHEVGHLLHLHHPDPQCPGPGLPAPVMAQQSGGPGPCLPHSWPLQWEIDLAAQRREPLAPPSSHDASGHRPTPPPARS